MRAEWHLCLGFPRQQGVGGESQFKGQSENPPKLPWRGKTPPDNTRFPAKTILAGNLAMNPKPKTYTRLKFIFGLLWSRLQGVNYNRIEKEEEVMTEKKVAVITGASSGIGEATAKLLAENGLIVVLAARREERLKELAEEIKSNGGEALYRVTDVSNHSDVEELIKVAIENFGKVDILINSAGIMAHSPLKNKRISDWDNMIDINLKGTLYGIGAVLPYRNAKKSGHIINISSVAGHYAHAGGAVYSATKWAVRAISESLREEVAKDGSNIRVSVISPGAINTELLSSMTDANLRKNYEEFYENFGIPVERVASVIQQVIDVPADSAWNEVIIRPTKQVQ